MTRSIWKLPFVKYNLLNKIYNQAQTTNVWSKQSMILPAFVGLQFSVYNGKTLLNVKITENMIGHKLGEFILTRKRHIYKKKKKKKK
jgi:small subunit ribosomal protein S19